MSCKTSTVARKNRNNPAVAGIADRTALEILIRCKDHVICMCVFFRTALEILGVGNLKAPGGCRGVECCTVVFLGEHFLFNCSDTFALGCII